MSWTFFFVLRSVNVHIWDPLLLALMIKAVNSPLLNGALVSLHEGLFFPDVDLS